MKTLKKVLATVKVSLLAVLLVLTGIFSIFNPTLFYVARYFLIGLFVVTALAWLGDMAMKFALPTDELEQEDGRDEFYAELEKCNSREDYMNLYVLAKRDHDPVKLKQIVFSYKLYERACKEAQKAFDEEEEMINPLSITEVPTSEKKTDVETEDFSEECAKLLTKYSPQRMKEDEQPESSECSPSINDATEESVDEEGQESEISPLLSSVVKEVASSNKAREEASQSEISALLKVIKGEESGRNAEESKPEDVKLTLPSDEAEDDIWGFDGEDDADDDEDDDEIVSLKRLLNASKRAENLD